MKHLCAGPLNDTRLQSETETVSQQCEIPMLHAVSMALEIGLHIDACEGGHCIRESEVYAGPPVALDWHYKCYAVAGDAPTSPLRTLGLILAFCCSTFYSPPAARGHLVHSAPSWPLHHALHWRSSLKFTSSMFHIPPLISEFTAATCRIV